MIGEGDSWFSHPTEWNILYHLSERGGYAIRRIARTGVTLRDRVREAPDHTPPYVRQLRRRLPWALLLVSGGGNDLLGDPLPDMLRHRSEVPRGWRALLRDDIVDAELARIRRAYERIVFRTAQLQPGCQILAHGYDRPYPRDAGATLFWGRITVAGPWLHPVMADEKGIRDREVQHRLAGELVDRFNAMLRELARRHPTFHHVDLRGTLTSVRQWADEIHPHGAGFGRMATRFRAAMDAALGGRR